MEYFLAGKKGTNSCPLQQLGCLWGILLSERILCEIIASCTLPLQIGRSPRHTHCEELTVGCLAWGRGSHKEAWERALGQWSHSKGGLSCWLYVCVRTQNCAPWGRNTQFYCQFFLKPDWPGSFPGRWLSVPAGCLVKISRKSLAITSGKDSGENRPAYHEGMLVGSQA